VVWQHHERLLVTCSLGVWSAKGSRPAVTDDSLVVTHAGEDSVHQEPSAIKRRLREDECGSGKGDKKGDGIHRILGLSTPGNVIRQPKCKTAARTASRTQPCRAVLSRPEPRRAEPCRAVMRRIAQKNEMNVEGTDLRPSEPCVCVCACVCLCACALAGTWYCPPRPWRRLQHSQHTGKGRSLTSLALLC
jgi:hypothetical protein